MHRQISNGLERVFRKVTGTPRRRPRVSVVIKSFNHEKYIGKTIDSILAQTLQDFEIILTDDGSTDGTVDVIRGYLKDARIRFEALPVNLGVPNAMNVSIKRASAPLIAILNSDDFAMPERLATQLAYLDAHPAAAAVFSKPLCVDEDGNATADRELFAAPFALPDYSHATWLRQFFLKGNCLCAPSAMIRASAYDAAGAYDRRLTNLSDLDMWVRMLSHGEIHVLPDRLTAFRIRDDNANLGAPRLDSQLRLPFEYSRILEHYLSMNPMILRAAFADIFVKYDLDPGGDIGLLLAETALRLASTGHRLFALETFFRRACTDSDFARLREITGSVNVFGISVDHGLRM